MMCTFRGDVVSNFSPIWSHVNENKTKKGTCPPNWTTDPRVTTVAARNHCIKQTLVSVLPEDWKKTQISDIYKKGDRCDLRNCVYVVCKTMKTSKHRYPGHEKNDRFNNK